MPSDHGQDNRTFARAGSVKERAQDSGAQDRAGPARVKSADRALDLMEMLVQAPHGLRHAELAASQAIPKSSLSKLLASLIASGYVERIDGAFVVGERWRALVRASIAGRSIDALVQPSLQRLVYVTGETAGFNMIVNRQIETISSISSEQQLRYTMIVGERSPPHRMSAGLAILAHMSPAFQARYHLQTASQDRASPLRDRKAFLKAMEEIRVAGFASASGFRDGIRGFSVPLLTANGKPLASLNVAIPEARLDDEGRTIALTILKTVAADLAKRLDGWIDPPEEWP